MRSYESKIIIMISFVRSKITGNTIFDQAFTFWLAFLHNDWTLSLKIRCLSTFIPSTSRIYYLQSFNQLHLLGMIQPCNWQEGDIYLALLWSFRYFYRICSYLFDLFAYAVWSVVIRLTCSIKVKSLLYLRIPIWPWTISVI